MLTSLSIKNFRGIQTCDIEDLRRINLFIGKNDSGKSTILEAAYYMFRELCSPPQLNMIMGRRTNIFAGSSELWFRYKTNLNLLVSGAFNPFQVIWTVEWIKERPSVRSGFDLLRRHGISTQERIELGYNEYSVYNLSQVLGRGRIALREATGESGEKLMHYALNASLIDCTLKSRTSDIESVMGRLKIEGNDMRFGEILNDTYGKGSEWEFVPHPERPDEKRLAVKEAGKLTYVSDFGDGLRCCVGILGTMMASTNTGIFVEEIESHQHIGSLRKLVQHLVNIARQNNLQVFLTTHSDDVWNSLARGVYRDDVEREKEEFNCFLTERDPESGKVTVERTEDVQKINNALGST